MDQWTQRRIYEIDNTPKPFNSSSFDMEFQRDRARVIHSAAFRRLQSKTQVLGLGESDFYRTRLTHSLEVLQIGTGIVEKINESFDDQHEIKEWMPSKYLTEAVCLAHDIGHPPFGHGGEVALNYMMRGHGGFEGNAHTLRIVAKLGEYSKENGLDLTRRAMLGLLKYPAPYTEVLNPLVYKNENAPINLDSWKPPKCIFDEDVEILNWIIAPFDENDKTKFKQLIDKGEGKHKKTVYKSFDSSIMDIADDISYGVHDFEDALALRLIDKDIWKEVEQHLENLGHNEILENIEFYNKHLFSSLSNERKHAISKMIGYFMKNIIIEEKNFNHPLLKYNVALELTARKALDILQDFIVKYVIKRPEVQTLEYKGQQMIVKLFEIIEANPSRILPEQTFQEYKESNFDMRIICDYIAGMTDNFASKLFHKAFSPNIGSIFDRI